MQGVGRHRSDAKLVRNLVSRAQYGEKDGTQLFVKACLNVISHVAALGRVCYLSAK